MKMNYSKSVDNISEIIVNIDLAIRNIKKVIFCIENIESVEHADYAEVIGMLDGILNKLESIDIHADITIDNEPKEG